MQRRILLSDLKRLEVNKWKGENDLANRLASDLLSVLIQRVAKR